MQELKKILVPIDFSDASKAALDHALLLAKEYECELHLLYVATLGEPFGRNSHPFPEREEILRRMFEVADSELGHLMSGRSTGGITIVEEKRPGYSVSQILLDYAAEVGIDLVVMGTHGRRGPIRWTLGSVAEEVVRTAPYPVVVVPGSKAPGADLGEIRKILVPLDLTETSQPVLRTAERIALRVGASLQLLHIVDLHTLPAFYGVAFDEIEERVARRADEALAELADTMNLRVPHESFIEGGRAARSIVRFAKEHGSDLIVVGSHTRSGLDRWLLGSTADRVLRGTPCPVLAFRVAAVEAANDEPSIVDEGVETEGVAG